MKVGKTETHAAEGIERRSDVESGMLIPATESQHGESVQRPISDLDIGVQMCPTGGGRKPYRALLVRDERAALEGVLGAGNRRHRPRVTGPAMEGKTF